jgi:hypothetical protein
MEKTTSATALRSSEFQARQNRQATVVFKAETEEGRYSHGDDDDDDECGWTQDFRESHGDCGFKSEIGCCKARSAMI